MIGTKMMVLEKVLKMEAKSLSTMVTRSSKRVQVRFNELEGWQLEKLHKLTGLANVSEVVHYAVGVAINYIEKVVNPVLEDNNFRTYMLREGHSKRLLTEKKRAYKQKTVNICEG